MNYDISSREKAKMHTLDRIIVLKPMEGKTPVSSTGIADKRLFTGENRLHALFDIATGMWYLRYDNGNLPGALDVKYISLPELLDYVKQYFARRNVEIVDIQDAYRD